MSAGKSNVSKHKSTTDATQKPNLLEAAGRFLGKRIRTKTNGKSNQSFTQRADRQNQILKDLGYK